MNAQSVALTNHLGNLGKLVGNFLGNLDAHLHIVVVFHKPFHLLHVLRIIGIVIVHVHGTQLVEAVNHHAFTVCINKAQRTSYLVHTLLTPPLLDSSKQCLADFNIIDEVEPAEAHLMAIPTLVGSAIDDGCYAPYHLSVTESHEVFRLTTFERRILVGSQRCHFFTQQKGYGALVPTIQIVVELHKRSQFFVIRHRSDFYLAHGTFFFSVCKGTK